MDKLIARLKQSPFAQHHNIPYLEGIRNQISKATCDSYEMIRFKTHLDELDVRGNLDWKSIYPDCRNIWKEYYTDVLFQELKILNMPRTRKLKMLGTLRNLKSKHIMVRL